jgi:hypothetical protein
MDNNQTPTPTASPPILDRVRTFLSSNPWLLAAGTLSGIVGIPLAVYLYVIGIEQPALTYYVEPYRTELAESMSGSDITVLYKGQPTSGFVSIARVGVWNAGKKPIRQSDILSPISFALPKGHRIFETEVLRRSRDVVGLKLDQSKIADGIVGVKFAVMEHNDWGILQVVYEGHQYLEFNASGAIVGQQNILEPRNKGDLDPRLSGPMMLMRFLAFMGGVVGLVGVVAFKNTSTVIRVFLIVLGSFELFAFVWLALEQFDTPPFRF